MSTTTMSLLLEEEGWDSNVLWLSVTEDEVKTNYERKIVPDPSRYYIKDYPLYSTQFSELRLIPPKYKIQKT
jgi:hypothetical protein